MPVTSICSRSLRGSAEVKVCAETEPRFRASGSDVLEVTVVVVLVISVAPEPSAAV